MHASDSSAKKNPVHTVKRNERTPVARQCVRIFETSVPLMCNLTLAHYTVDAYNLYTLHRYICVVIRRRVAHLLPHQVVIMVFVAVVDVFFLFYDS